MGHQGARQKKVGKQSADVAEATKREILKASLCCFATRGYAATSLRDIAEMSNTSHGLIRHHFDSKENLWQATVAQELGRLAELQLPVVEQVTEENAVESLNTVIRTLIDYAGKHPELMQLLVFEALNDSERLNRLITIMEPLHARITPLFKEVQAQGYFRDFDENTFFILVWSAGTLPFALSSFTNKLCSFDISSDREAAAHADRILNVLSGAFAG